MEVAMSSDYDVIVEVVASNILGEPREVNYAAVPRAADRRLRARARGDEWLQQAAVAIRASVPLAVVRDTIGRKRSLWQRFSGMGAGGFEPPTSRV
jgi:hypothetical protein